MQKSIYILVCVFERTCDDPRVQSFSPIIQFHEDAAQGSSVSVFASLKLFYYAYCMRVLVNLENHKNCIRMMFAYLKHSLLVGVLRCLDCMGLSLHPFKNFE